MRCTITRDQRFWSIQGRQWWKDSPWEEPSTYGPGHLCRTEHQKCVFKDLYGTADYKPFY